MERPADKLPEPGTEAIAVSDLSYSFGTSLPALSEVSFRISEGEVVSFVGPNGAGKTTLLRCLSGIFLPGAGTIAYFGRGVASYTRQELARFVGYVPQGAEFVYPFRVKEFLGLSRYPHLGRFARFGDDDREQIERVIEFMGLGAFRTRAINTLSGGERQKVLIASALAQTPKILLLDEPLTHLDPGQADETAALLLQAREKFRVTICAVMHDLNRAALYAGRVVALRSGRILYDGEPERFMTQDVLREIYGGEFVLAPHPSRDLMMAIPRGAA